TSGARDLRRGALGSRLSRARLRHRLVAYARRGHRHRARLLRAPQHVADQCHADDAAGAGNRRRDLLLRALSRPDAGGRRVRARGALVFDRFTAVPLFMAPAVALPALAWWFAAKLRRRMMEEKRQRTEVGKA